MWQPIGWGILSYGFLGYHFLSAMALSFFISCPLLGDIQISSVNTYFEGDLGVLCLLLVFQRINALMLVALAISMQLRIQTGEKNL